MNFRILGTRLIRIIYDALFKISDPDSVRVKNFFLKF